MDARVRARDWSKTALGPIERWSPALRETLQRTFLVALSGYAAAEDLQRATEAGFPQHIAKPPALERLAQVIAAVPRT